MVEKNREEADRIMAKYPDRIPVLVSKNEQSQTTPDIDKKRYLVPNDLTIGQFLYVIRKRIKLSSDKGLFLFINGEIVATNETVGATYDELHDKYDGFLHAVYSCENVFG